MDGSRALRFGAFDVSDVRPVAVRLDATEVDGLAPLEDRDGLADNDRGLWDDPDDGALARLMTRPDLPAGFDRWQLTLAAGARRLADADDWEGALVLVDQGRLEVDCAAGGRHTFRAGDLLVLGRLPLRSLHNPGDGPVRLVAVRRHGQHRSWACGAARGSGS